MGVVLNTVGVPKTNVDWLVAFRKATRGAAYYSIPRSGYHWLWLVRSYLITEMRHHGIMRLQITAEWGLAEVAEALVPDQRQWLHVWMTTLAGDSLKKLVKMLAYSEPLEMLSCCTCIFGDDAIIDIPETRIRALTYGIQRARRQHWKGQWEGHPSYTIQDVMARV